MVWKKNNLGQIDISEHIEYATSEFLSTEGKLLIEDAVEKYFNNSRSFTINKTCQILQVSKPTLRKYTREGRIKSVFENGREMYRADEVERVKESDPRYKRHM